MPIYEYQCQHCHHELEKLQKISDLPLVDCPVCYRPSLRKKVSAAGFKLKGTGWYETDFKQPKQTQASASTEAKTTTIDQTKANNSTNSTSTTTQD